MLRLSLTLALLAGALQPWQARAEEPVPPAGLAPASLAPASPTAAVTAEAESSTAAADSDDEEADAAALYQQGVVLEREEKFKQALERYQTALDADPQLVKAQRELARCYYKLGWKDAALREMKSYLAGDVHDPQAESFARAIEAQGVEIKAMEAPTRGAGPWSLALAGGYAWGFNSANFGRRYNGANNGTFFTYNYNVGEGAVAGLEALYQVQPGLALGLSTQPWQTYTSGSLTVYEPLTTTSDTTTVQHTVLPLFLNLHTRAQLAPGVHLGTFFGVGAVFPQPYLEDSVEHDSNTNGDFVTHVKYQRDLAPAMALRAGTEVEARFSPRLSGFLQASLMLAHIPATASNYYATTTDASGAQVLTATVDNNYVPNPPAAVTPVLNAVTLNPGPDRTVIITSDDGPTQYTLVRRFKSGVLQSEQLNETNAISAGGSQDDINVKQLTASAGLRWEF